MTEVNWGLIDKVVFINLERRTDRLTEITSELKKVKVPEDKIVHFKAIEDKEGAIGCAKSHLRVLIMAKMNGWKNVLILEDDMVFNNDEPSIKRFNVFLNELMHVEWDVGFLSASYFRIKKRKGCFYKVEFAYLANSYIVNQYYYTELMHNFSQAIYWMEGGVHRNKFSIDVSWLKLMKKDNWYGVYPCVGYQREGMSDIENENMDRRDFFSRSMEELRLHGSF